MYKRLYLFVITVLLLGLCAVSCQNSTHTIETAGAEVIAMMADMTSSDAYAALYNLPAAYEETVSSLREGDYRSPKTIYSLVLSDNSFLPGVDLDAISVSDELNDYLHAAACISLASTINQHSSIEAVSAASAYAAQMTFFCPTVTENTIRLYTFENGVPIAVFFLPGKDGTIRAIGYFLLHHALHTDSAEQIESSLADIGIIGVTVTKN